MTISVVDLSALAAVVQKIKPLPSLCNDELRLEERIDLPKIENALSGTRRREYDKYGR